MKYIGNCQTIDWDGLIKTLNQVEGKVLTYSASGNDLDLQWQRAGYKHGDPAIEWVQYWADQHFDKSIADLFGDWVGARPFYTFVSKIRVGKFIPFHTDHMKDQDSIPGNPVRFSCYISQSRLGQLSMVEDCVIHSTAIGDVWEWPSPSSQHSGVNVSDQDKYMFNFWGYR
jgi:hypothetical protein